MYPHMLYIILKLIEFRCAQNSKFIKKSVENYEKLIKNQSQKNIFQYSACVMPPMKP